MRKDESIRGWMKNVKRITDAGVKRWRPGMKVLREIRFYQRSMVLLIPVKVFCRLVRETGQGEKANIRWQSTAIFVLQNSIEDFVVCMFYDANLCAIYAKRKKPSWPVTFNWHIGFVVNAAKSFAVTI